MLALRRWDLGFVSDGFSTDVACATKDATAVSDDVVLVARSFFRQTLMIAVSHSVLKGETIDLDSWIGFGSVAAANESGNNFTGSDAVKKALSEYFPATFEHFMEDSSSGRSRSRSIACGQYGVFTLTVASQRKHSRLYAVLQSHGRLRRYVMNTPRVDAFLGLHRQPESRPGRAPVSLFRNRRSSK